MSPLALRRFVSVFSTGLLAVLFSAGCATAGPVVAPTSEATAAPSASSPVTGGTLTFAQGGDAVSLYPHRITELVSGQVTRQINETLVRLDAKGNLVPLLAKSWKVADDNKTWTFTLVSGVKFTDGTPFNAQAAKINLDTILDPKNSLPSRTVIGVIDNVEAKDDTTLIIHTKVPYSLLPYHLSHYSIGMVSPAALQKYGKNIDQNPVGTGPFKFVKWVPKDSIELVRNDGYWGPKPYLDRIIFRSMPEAASRIAALEKGDVDMITNVPTQEVDRLKAEKGITILQAPFNGVVFIALNNSKKPFSDPRVRQAVNYAVDRDSIVKNVLKGFGQVADGPVASNVYGFTRIGFYNYDPDKAKRLLAEAGYPNGFETTILTPEGRYLADRETAEAVQGQLSTIGIKAKVQVMDWSAYQAYFRTTPQDSKFDMALWSLGPSTNEADWVLNSMYNSASWAPKSNNRTYYKNPQVDDLIAQAEAELDPAKQKQIWATVLKTIETDAPDLYLHEYQLLFGVRTNVHGIVNLPIQELYLDTVWKSQ